jgi:hypothetical protein
MVGSVPPASPRYNVAATIRDTLHELRLIRNCLEGQVARLDRLERELAALLGGSTVAAGIRLTAEPSHVAHNLEIEQRVDGSAIVSIDGGRRFTLAPQLAEVFRFISSGEKDRGGKDPLVGWRSRSEILDFLADSYSRSFNQRYINNLVHRLKHALQQAGYDCGLIQTHRRKGVRFAFKRGARILPESFPPENL